MRSICLTVLLLLSLLFSSCNKGDVSSLPNTSNAHDDKNNSSISCPAGNAQSDVGSQAAESTNIITTVTPPSDLSVHTDASANIEIGGLWETDKGQYLIRMSSNTYNIVFFDYALMKQYPLCNKPNCAHNGAGCNSYLGSRGNKTQGGYSYSHKEIAIESYLKSIFVYNSRLYILINNEIISMKPDGTDRFVLVKIPDKYFSMTLLYADGEFIIEASVYKPANNDKLDVDIITAFLKLDISKKEIVELSTWKSPNHKATEKILGIYNENAYFLRVMEGEQLSGATQESYDRALNSVKNGIVKINIKSGERETFIQDQTAFRIDYVQFLGNCIYYHSRQDKIIYEINLPTGDKKSLIKNLDGYCGVTTIENGKLIYYIYYNESDFDKKDPRKPGKFYYDMRTGNMQPIKPITGGSEAIVYGTFQGDYLMRVSETKDNFQVGKISKTDFWAGAYNKAKGKFTFAIKDAKQSAISGGII